MDSLNPWAVAGALVVFVCGAILILARLDRDAPKAWKAVKAIASFPFILERIWSEFQNNGGSSLRDKVDQTHRFAAEAATEAKLARVISEATASRVGVEVDRLRADLRHHEEEFHGDR